MSTTTRTDTHGLIIGKATRLLVVALAALVLAACSSTVTRTTGSTPKYGATTVVQRGDTLYRIATQNGIAVRDLAAWNGLAPPYTIYPGQRLSLFPGNGRSVPPKSTVSTTTRAGTPAPGKGTSRAPSTPTPSAAPVNSGVAWKWPVDGQLLSRFEAGEPTKQGIDIAGTTSSGCRRMATTAPAWWPRARWSRPASRSPSWGAPAPPATCCTSRSVTTASRSIRCFTCRANNGVSRAG